jgi:hypothetical protein
MRLERCPMEIQVSFPRLDDWLSYECLDEVEVGDHVEILEEARREMVGDGRWSATGDGRHRRGVATRFLQGKAGQVPQDLEGDRQAGAH